MDSQLVAISAKIPSMIRERAKGYRERAQACLDAAEKAEDPEAKRYWTEAAKRWITLADQIDQAVDLFDSLNPPEH